MSEQTLKERIDAIVERITLDTIRYVDLNPFTVRARVKQIIMLGVEIGFEMAREINDQDCCDAKYPTFADLKKEIEDGKK